MYPQHPTRNGIGVIYTWKDAAKSPVSQLIGRSQLSALRTRIIRNDRARPPKQHLADGIVVIN